jgi:hypothetical protein
LQGTAPPGERVVLDQPNCIITSSALISEYPPMPAPGPPSLTPSVDRSSKLQAGCPGRPCGRPRWRPGSPVTNLDLIVAGHPLDANARLAYGGTGALTRLLCGGFVLDDPAPAALTSLLPPVLQINSRSADITTWLEPVFALVRQEADSTAPGAQAIFAKLADVFLSQALRTYLAGAEQAACWRPGKRPTRRSGRPWPRCTTGQR